MKIHSVRTAAIVTLAAVLSMGASCVSDNDGTWGNGGYNGGGYNGNDEDRPNRIPRRADLVREGDGKLRWRADLDGALYVFDRDSNVIRYSGRVRRGDEVEVRPKADQVLVNSSAVSKENLRKDGYHQLYFVAAGSGRDRNDRNDRNDRSNDDWWGNSGRSSGDLPYGARRLTRGGGTLDVASCPGGGSVYVYDEDASSTVYSVSVRRGTRFRVVPRDGKVYVDGDLISHQRFPRGHTLGVYFVGY